MSTNILQVSDDFWNIRGDFKIGGVVNIGTHTSLVRRANGKFVLLDAYTLKGEQKAKVDAVTREGQDIEAIINLHPFHTVHVERVHNLYPNAKLYGTARHIKRLPDLPWESALTESDECAELFADDFEFSVPDGVDFISSNEHLHFSSVLAYHKASKTIHSDDTLMYFRVPGPLGMLMKPEVKFHMTLAKTLEKRPAAAEDFRNWAKQLILAWGDAENLCAAHSAALLAVDNNGDSIADRIRSALEAVEKTLRAHEKRHG